MKLIGILGGTFDPIHYGHLTIADQVLRSVQCDRIDFIPCFKPPHRDQPIATPPERFDMVQLAVAPFSQFFANPIEIRRQGVSYTIDTLRHLHAISSNETLCLILGSDAFAQLNTWREWQSLFDYAHIIVVTRPQSALPHSAWLTTLTQEREITHSNQLRENRAGNIYTLDIAPIDISATHIREEIRDNIANINALPKTVYEYIINHALYTEKEN